MKVCVGRTQGMKFQKGLVQVLLQTQGGFQGILGFAPLILGRLLQERQRIQTSRHRPPHEGQKLHFPAAIWGQRPSGALGQSLPPPRLVSVNDVCRSHGGSHRPS